MSLSVPPSHGPLATFHLVKSILTWKGIVTVLASTESGKILLEKLVAWLDAFERPTDVASESVAIATAPLLCPAPDVACLIALRCFLLWADDEEAMAVLERDTHVRWYLQRVLDRNQGIIDETTEIATYVLSKLDRD